MSEQEGRRSPPRLAPRPAVLQHVPQQTIRKTKTRISNACLACKARKTKCDNNKPKCSACTAKPNSECVYMPFLDKRKRQKGSSGDDVKQKEHEMLSKIFNATKYCSSDELPKLLEIIRGDSSIEQIGQYVQDHLESNQYGYGPNSELGPLPETEPEHPEMSNVLPSFRRSSDAMDISNITQVSVPMVPSQPWTTISNDDEFVSHLVQLYFTWDTPLYDIVQREPFLSDMETGEVESSSYCSPMLVNAILAIACFHSDRPESYARPGDPTTAGEHFFREAERIWNSTSPLTSLTNMEALAIMHYFQAHTGNDGTVFNYLDIAMDMYDAFSSGRSDGVDKQGSPLQLEWPCWKLWTSCCITALVLRRPYQSQPPTLARPQNPQQDDPSDTWQPYPQIMRSYPQRRINLANMCIDLAFIARDISLFFYTKEKYNPEAGFLIEFHEQLLDWYDGYQKLPLNGDIAPDLAIRILYHSIEIHLFRSTMTGVAMASIENCQMISAALKASFASGKCLKLYSQLYGAKSTTHITNNAFQSALVTVYFLDRKEYKETFIQCAKVLWRLGKKSIMSAFQLWIVGLLARREDITLPEEVTTILREVGQIEDKFKGLMSKLPMPATSGGGLALKKFKEEFLEHESTEYRFGWQQASAAQRPGGTITTDIGPQEQATTALKPPDFSNGIDPAVGDLTEVYQKWSLFGE